MDYISVIDKMNYIGKICLIICVVLFLYRIVFIFFGFSKDVQYPSTDKKGKFAILIPARNESKVISKLLSSIKKQTYDKSLIDVYVVVESESDPTISIVKSFGYNYFVRKDMENKHTKGYALDDVVKSIYCGGGKFDAFFIFDADNILKENFIEEMNKVYQSGIPVAFAYRNSINIHDSWVSLCSALLFTNITTFQNKAKSKLYSHILISGTGYYISHTILDKYKGFPFHSLTEDAEFTKYCLYNNIKSKYVTTTEFYDEQPNNMKTVSKQRLRWIKGFNNAGKTYDRKIFKQLFKKGSNKLAIIDNTLSVLPNLFFVATFLLYNLTLSVFLVSAILANNVAVKIILFNMLQAVGFYFFVMSVFTILQIISEQDHFTLSFREKVVAVLMNPLFIFHWIPCYIKSVFTKDVKWTPIEHTATELQLDVLEEQVEEDEVKVDVKK